MDIYDLIGVHDLMDDSKNSVAEEILQRFEQGENLPEMAFKIVFEHLDYFREIREEVTVLEKLIVKEQPVPEYLTTSFGILGQLDKNF